MRTNIYGTFYIILLILNNQQYKQKNDRCHEKNWKSSLRSTEESIVNQNSFRVLSIL